MLFHILGIQSGKFAHFDLGKNGNIRKYGQETPPEFSIEAMHVPIASYWSQGGFQLLDLIIMELKSHMTC